jgi:predicted permease
MNNFLFSVNVVAPLFFLMTLGYFLKCIRFVSEDFLSQLNRFVFKFCLPLMLFQDIRNSYNGDFSNTKLIFSSLIGISVVIFLSFCFIPFFVKRKGQRGSMIQSIYRSNFLIYGLPLATGMYGVQAVATISMLMGVMIPFFNVLAVIILSVFSETESEKFSFVSVLKDIITNPLILGCFFGLVAGMTGFCLPQFIDGPLSQLAGAASPIALFVMGGEFRFKSLRNNVLKVLSATVIRLIIVPVTALTIFVAMGFRNVELSVLLCLFATPTAMASYIMAKNMGCDGELSGQIVVLTTACSCLTIFLLVFILRSMGFL